ncbi:hypothetical protein FHX08_002461 [Rhizobium sp. BK529]|uniref:hypothetical protein n=1 Tax=unclassified Rhizobium TaxID=2613769 RepID=UPI001046B248|nr:MULTISPECIES: hypothetical protein [unclassified Rhizobium]MBB3592117.1 hypothetical protein [Rhizobium sp. BK529]TCS06539.1 hypothetical protein EV281_102142 [Rhizobium sp. BK418]
MVSSVSNIRLERAQIALQVIKGNSSESSSSSSTGHDYSSLPSQSRSALSVMLDKINSGKTGSTDASGNTVASTDITTASFMALLRQNMTAAADAKGENSQEAAMLAAFKKGQLAVTDPIQGVSIKAWDVTDPKEADVEQKKGTAIKTDDWNDFLRDHLQRDSHGRLVRSENGSFIEKGTGNEVYFGQVGTQNYYITWPVKTETKPATDGGKSDSTKSGTADTSGTQKPATNSTADTSVKSS